MKFDFCLAPTPRIVFGVGRIQDLPAIIDSFGTRVLLLLGTSSFKKTIHWQNLQQALEDRAMDFWVEHVGAEPSPELVDAISERYRGKNIEVVTAIGGGSVLDGGKAVAAMLACSGSIVRYLEGVGDSRPDGARLPCIAVPTTSGTGSEVTSNAVITHVGKKGFKKSLRHENYIPDVALLDPALISTCPLEITINCAMDAFTQLVESYLSPKAFPLTDDLALGALRRIRSSLSAVCRGEGSIIDRSNMAYAACISGITLTNAGLGVIHGFASVIGGLFPIPHGVVCGTLMAAGNAINLQRLRTEKEQGTVALQKYAALGRIFSDREKGGDAYYQDGFIAMLQQLTSDLKIDMLGRYGIREADVQKIVQQSDCKNNPVNLSTDDMGAILAARL